MWTQFILEDARFSIDIVAALTFFAVTWLYWDSKTIGKKWYFMVRILGFSLLAIYFLLSAARMESLILPVSIWGNTDTIMWFFSGLKMAGYLGILLSLLGEPIVDKPSKANMASLVLGAMTVSGRYDLFVLPVLAGACALLYLRRATIGLEDHLKPVSLAFFALALSEMLGLVNTFSQSQNVFLFKLAQAFGPIWIGQYLLLLIGIAILGRWVVGYLLRQFFTQIFMFSTLSIIAIFLLTTLAFSGLLVRNVQMEAQSQLSSDAKVLLQNISARQNEILSDTSLLATNDTVLKGLADKNRNILNPVLEEFLLAKKLESLVILDKSGVVVARAEDKDKYGQNLAADDLVKRGLLGQNTASVTVIDGVVGSNLDIAAISVIKDKDGIAGFVKGESRIDDSLVDGIKASTGLEVSVFANDTLSATTILGPDGVTRLQGVKDPIAEKLTAYSGFTYVGGRSFLGSYEPILNMDNNPVGMVFVGKSSLGVLQTVGKTIELTFLATIILIGVSILPSYFISRYLSYQIR